MARNKRASVGPLAGIIGFMFVAFMIAMLWFTVKGVYGVISMVAIPLFVLAMILNFSVVKDYFNWIVNNIKADPIKGIAMGVGSYLLFPLVSLYLAFKAYTTRKLKKQTEQKVTKKKKGEEYIKYEEVDDNEDFLELEDLDKPKTRVKQPQARTQAPDNKYDDLFN